MESRGWGPARISEWWLAMFPILSFLLGAPVLLYEVFYDRPRDNLVLGIAAVACGIAPVGVFGLADRVRQAKGGNLEPD